MSRRNMFKIVAETEVPDHWNMTLEEIQPLLFRMQTRDGQFYVIRDAFRYGFTLGRRYEKSRQRRKV